jgi:hypothetical protein
VVKAAGGGTKKQKEEKITMACNQFSAICTALSGALSIDIDRIRIDEVNISGGCGIAPLPIAPDSPTKNEVVFEGGQNTTLLDAFFTLKDFYVTSGKSSSLVRGTTYHGTPDKNKVTFTFPIDRKNSKDTTQWFQAATGGDQNCVTRMPGDYNFALWGDLELHWRHNGGEEQAASFNDIVLGQFYSNWENYWNLGGQTLSGNGYENSLAYYQTVHPANANYTFARSGDLTPNAFIFTDKS